MKRAFAVAGIAIAIAVSTYSERAVAAKTTDASDLWWIPTESGWGIQLVQQETTIFATMFVYGTNKQPTWYVGLLSKDTPTTYAWTGTLYATTGPWFGTVPFDPAATTAAPVGTMHFAPNSVYTATLTYSVNGVQVAKNIERESLTTIDFTGSYSGVLSQATSGSNCPSLVNTDSTSATYKITHDGASIRVNATTQAGTCTFDGSYGQGGHFGFADGNYTCTSGDAGTFHFFEMASSWFEFRARTRLTSQSGCIFTGFAIGLRQPPPAQ